MCGICGWVGRPPDTARLDAAMLAMEHRGPDDQGCWLSDRVMLGHRRLSIIDLSPLGRQPMASETGLTQVVLNGEIYNFRELRSKLQRNHLFRSATDTEVLIHGYEEWGIEGLLERVSGMFAFALWDDGAQVLHLARDPVGKKPLFYTHANGLFAFASTLPALLKLLPWTPTVEPTALQDFLLYQCVPSDSTIVRGVHKLRPGERAERREDYFARSFYWEPTFASQKQRTQEEWIEEVDETVTAAVARRLISDVPVGVFLSGGVDSSLVTALMVRQIMGRVTTLSAGFEERTLNELPHARRVAQYLGTDHHELVVTPAALLDLPALVFAAGEPFADPALIPTLALARAAREHVTVVLTGDGGDESFAGYASSIIARTADVYRHVLPNMLRRTLIPEALKMLQRLNGGVGRWARRALRVAVAGRDQNVIRWEYDPLGQKGFRGRLEEVLDPRFRAQLGNRDPDAYWAGVIASSDGPTTVDRVLYTELRTLLPDQFLVKTDVATMAYGLEARCPLLDPAGIQLAASLPAKVKYGWLSNKRLLRKVAARYVPGDLLDRPKHGFVVPTNSGLRLSEALISEVLLSKEALSRGFFVASAIRRLLDEHRAGRSDHGQRLWALLVLELWMRMFMDGSLSAHDLLEDSRLASEGPQISLSARGAEL